MAVLKHDHFSSVEVEVLPDDEYALWEQAVTDAERHKAERGISEALQLESLPSQQPAAEEHANASVDEAVASALDAVLPDLEDFGLKVNRRAKHRPRGLRVTDITRAEWCQQQLAFALSARLPKVSIGSDLFGVVNTLTPATTATGSHRDRVDGSWYNCTCSSGG